MIHDVIIVGAGAAGLFAGINAPKNISKIILEKMPKPGMKVLLSGGERANVSNIDIEPERDYFGQNKKALISIFSRFNQWDIMTYFDSVGIKIIEEDRGRLILESGDSRELLEVLLREAKDNNCELKIKQAVKNIEFREKKNTYTIKTESGESYIGKNVIISSGGKSFFQVGTTGEGYNIAKEFGLRLHSPYRSLCGLTTKQDLSKLSGSSIDLGLKMLDNKKEIYSEFGPLLFTHFGVSGPIVFNTATAMGEYLNSLKIESEQDKIKYILKNITLELNISEKNATKKIHSFFKEPIENEETITLGLQDWRSWKEAKATGGGVDIDELDNNMQSKKYPGLYFIGEVVDITGKTGGFNLQWAWSSGYVVGKSLG